MFDSDLYQDGFVEAMDRLVDGESGSLFRVSGDVVSGSFSLICADGSEHSFGFTMSVDSDFGRECYQWGFYWGLSGGCVYCSAIAADGSLLGFWERH